jgi:cytochrome bd-type quinol oxidase subunit 2
MTLAEAAAPDATLSAIFVVFGIACVLVLPALFLLYFLAQSDYLEHEH